MIVKYGTNPGVIRLEGRTPEPILIWEPTEVMRLIVDLCDAFHAAWPDHDITTPREKKTDDEGGRTHRPK